MKAITDRKSWPKFLKVRGAVVKEMNYNKYLLKPWEAGELVKVVPYEEQKSSVNTPAEEFRKRYVNVIRKDSEGKWTLHYNWVWDLFEPLK